MLFQQLLLAGSASATCLHGLSKFKRAEGAEGVVQFGYTGLIGPFNWASLAEENEACKTGKNQSPINIDDSIQISTAKPTITIDSTLAVEFENLGTTLEVGVNGTTSICRGNATTDFRLKQFHLHTPSEHRIAEEYFPVEAHFVHEGVADPTQLAVIGVLFQLSSAANASSPILSGLVPHLDAVAEPGSKTEIEEGLDFTGFVQHVQDGELFEYSGSLTTPPCSEGVTFLIAREPLAVDVETFNAIKKVVKFNSRVTQNALGGENLIKVGALSGTEDAILPEELEVEQPAEGGNATVSGHPAVTPGATVTISEVEGAPTSLLGVVASGH